MTRSVPEWVGKTSDTAAPTRVRLRIIDRQGGKCGTCNRKLGVAGEEIEIDHVLALINGGENRENNLQALCGMCHKPKTAEDVAQKARNARKRAKHLGLKQTKRKLPGSKGSGLRRRMDGTVWRE